MFDIARKQPCNGTVTKACGAECLRRGEEGFVVDGINDVDDSDQHRMLRCLQ